MNAIRVENIVKRFGEVTALKGVSLEIEKGELFFLLGGSGCGKTTLLRCIAGLEEPTEGKVFFGNDDVTRLPTHKREAAMVFQSYALWPHLSVGKNIAFGLEERKVPRKRDRGAGRGGLWPWSASKVTARAGSIRCPAGSSSGSRWPGLWWSAPMPSAWTNLSPILDAQLRLEMRSEIRRIVKENGLTGVYVTHDQAEALSMADRMAVMDQGEIIQVGSPETVYRQPRSGYVAGFIGETNLLRGEISEVSAEKIGLRFGEIVIEGRKTDPDWSPANGDPATASLRPEALSVSAAHRRSPRRNHQPGLPRKRHPIRGPPPHRPDPPRLRNEPPRSPRNRKLGQLGIRSPRRGHPRKLAPHDHFLEKIPRHFPTARRGGGRPHPAQESGRSRCSGCRYPPRNHHPAHRDDPPRDRRGLRRPLPEDPRKNGLPQLAHPRRNLGNQAGPRQLLPAARKPTDGTASESIFFSAAASMTSPSRPRSVASQTLRVFEHPGGAFHPGIIPETMSGEIYYGPDRDWVGVCLSSFGIFTISTASPDGDSRNRSIGPTSATPATPRSCPRRSHQERIGRQSLRDALAGKNAPSSSGRTPREEALEAGWAAGLDLIQRISANSRYFADSASKVPHDVAQGNAVAGMSIDFYGRTFSEAVKREDGSSRVQFVSPVGGTSVSADPVAILKGAPNWSWLRNSWNFSSPKMPRCSGTRGRHRIRPHPSRPPPPPHPTRSLPNSLSRNDGRCRGDALRGRLAIHLRRLPDRLPFLSPPGHRPGHVHRFPSRNERSLGGPRRRRLSSAGHREIFPNRTRHLLRHPPENQTHAQIRRQNPSRPPHRRAGFLLPQKLRGGQGFGEGGKMSHCGWGAPPPSRSQSLTPTPVLTCAIGIKARGSSAVGASGRSPQILCGLIPGIFHRSSKLAAAAKCWFHL